MVDAPASSSRLPGWTRWVGLALTLLLGALTALALYVDGRLPAPVPPDAPAYSPQPLLAALGAVDARGRLRLAELKAQRAPLDAYVASLAGTSPENHPERFPTPDDRLAYWLNAYHALVLQQLVDGWPALTSPDQLALGRFTWGRSWPVGGERLTLLAIERRYLRPADDARVFLARFTGAAGGPLLDGAPFDGATLDAQLNDAALRFMRRRENVAIDGHTVHLSRVLEDEREAFLEALPTGRRSILQLVWAFLPESCDGAYPGCDTRGDLDRACGGNLDHCTVVYEPGDRRVPARD